jgi:hypothetical protein
MFWTNNLNELFKFAIIPSNNMTFEEKLNAIMRLILFIGIISTLILNDTRYILFVLIILIISIFVYNYQEANIKNAEKFLDSKNLDIIENKICVKPTVDNPFMNPNIYDINYNSNKPSACSINDNQVYKNMNDSFYSRLFRDVGDIYGKMSSERQFYTVPSTTIPNDQNALAQWLYNRGPSCKENNGEQCFRNIN